MARARNIKPALFKNEILGVADPFLTLLFESLWCLADREGRLEDRPLRIKAETFPYREGLDVNGYLTELQRMGFIARYSVDGLALIQIVNFKKHQTPHNTEKASELPAQSAESLIPCGLPEVTVTPPLKDCEKTDALPPDSLNPPTDSGLLIPDTSPQAASAPPKYSAMDDLVANGVDSQVAADWLKVRKGKKLAPNKTGIDGVLRELAKAGMTPDQGIRLCCERGWGGFNPAWLANVQPRASPVRQQATPAQLSADNEEAKRLLFGSRNNLEVIDV